MKFRPKGWKNPHTGILNTPHTMKLERDAFEAGADAMLEGLRKSPAAKRITPEWGYHDNDGRLVFIPNEEE